MSVRQQIHRFSVSQRARALSAAAGAAAFLALAYLGVSMAPPASEVVRIPQAGSGSAPANTTYTQPTVGDMSVGATVTGTTPPSAPAVSMASPAVKAGT